MNRPLLGQSPHNPTQPVTKHNVVHVTVSNAPLRRNAVNGIFFSYRNRARRRIFWSPPENSVMVHDRQLLEPPRLIHTRPF